MIRRLFFALLFANGLFWFWQFLDSEPVSAGPTPKAVGIALLSEQSAKTKPAEMASTSTPAMPDASRAERPASIGSEPVPTTRIAETGLDQSHKPEVSPPGPVTAEGAELAQSVTPPDASGEATPSPEAVAPANPAVTSVPEAVRSQATETTPTPESAKTPPPEGTSSMAHTEPGSAGVAIAEAGSEPAKHDVPQCYRLGPLTQDGNLAALETTVRSRGWPTQRSERKETVKAGYLVYQAPLPSRQAALAAMRELRGKGVDSFVIAEGPYVNGLSLGLFSNEENARRQAANLRSKGLDVLVGPRLREATQIFLEISAPSAQTWAEMALDDQVPVEKIPCL